jgi:hypothetical protein
LCNPKGELAYKKLSIMHKEKENVSRNMDISINDSRNELRKGIEDIIYSINDFLMFEEANNHIKNNTSVLDGYLDKIDLDYVSFKELKQIISISNRQTLFFAEINDLFNEYNFKSIAFSEQMKKSILVP